MLKKKLSLGVLSLISMNNINALEGDIWLTPVTTYSGPNNTIDVEVHLDTGGKDADSFVLEMNWDEVKIALDTTINGGLEDIDGNEISNINMTPSSGADIRFVYNKASEVSGTDVKIATLHFKTTAAFTSGTQNIDLFTSSNNEQGSEVSAESSNSAGDFALLNLNVLNSAVIKAYEIRGDVNNDNRINSIDLSLMVRKITQLDMTTTAYIDTLATADVNCDGRVNSIDLALEQRYITGLDMSNTSWCDVKFPGVR